MNKIAHKNSELATASYTAQFEQLLSNSVYSDLPWLEQFCKNAYQNFLLQGFPDKDHEDWRYTDLITLLQTPFYFKPSITQEKFSSEKKSNILDSFYLHFTDYNFNPHLSTLNDLAESVIITDLKSALQTYPDLIQHYLAHSTANDSHGWINLHNSFIDQGVLIYLPKNVNLTKPIEINFHLEQAHLSYLPYHIIIVMEEDTKACVVQNFTTLSSIKHFTHIVDEIILKPNSDLEMIKIFHGESGNYFSSTQAKQQEKSRFQHYSFSWGADYIRQEVSSNLIGIKANCNLNGLNFVRLKQQMEHIIRVNHYSEQGTSLQSYKNVVDDKGRANFNGKILVSENANQTKAKQINKNLLISPQAQVNTRPQLEIYTKDVQCNHGSTVGKLDEKALFYLQSRGINRASANAMLLFAFMQDQINLLSLTDLKDYLTQLIQSAFNHEIF